MNIEILIGIGIILVSIFLVCLWDGSVRPLQILSYFKKKKRKQSAIKDGEYLVDKCIFGINRYRNDLGTEAWSVYFREDDDPEDEFQDFTTNDYKDYDLVDMGGFEFYTSCVNDIEDVVLFTNKKDAESMLNTIVGMEKDMTWHLVE